MKGRSEKGGTDDERQGLDTPSFLGRHTSTAWIGRGAGLIY